MNFSVVYIYKTSNYLQWLGILIFKGNFSSKLNMHILNKNSTKELNLFSFFPVAYLLMSKLLWSIRPEKYQTKKQTFWLRNCGKISKSLKNPINGFVNNLE